MFNLTTQELEKYIQDDLPYFDLTTCLYVKPESCVECVDHADSPRCAEACPTSGAIVWDMPYTVDFTSYYLTGHEKGEYKIREHKAKGLMLPEVKAQKFRVDIPMSARESHADVADF